MAALAMVGTLPGRTQGLGLITEPLLRDLHLDRLTYAGLNFWATIIGSVGAVGIGRLIDRFGSRTVLTGVAAALGVVVCLMSRTVSIVGLAVLMTATRALGQSALSVVSIAMVGQWFVRRIDLAMALYSVLLSIGFMIAFPIVGGMVQQHGWRFAWFMTGAGVLVLSVLSALIVRRNPEAIGLAPDGNADKGLAWRNAITTSAFWVFAFGTALYGLVASGIGLFNESILAEHGFGADVYYRALVVTAMTSLVGNFVGGWLATRTPLTHLLAASLAVLAGGVAVLPHVSSIALVMAWAATMGVGGGLVMVLFFSAWPRLFGRRHLGQIQGSAQALTVLASATGPLLLAWCIKATGSYTVMFRALAGVILLTGIAAMLIPLPRSQSLEVPKQGNS